MYQEELSKAGYGEITTEIVDAAPNPFYYAEDYHQQYLDKNPSGYCPNHRDRRDAARRLRGHAAAVRGLTAAAQVRSARWPSGGTPSTVAPARRRIYCNRTY